MDTKTCKQCGQSKPATPEFFVTCKGKSGKIYLIGRCRVCTNEEARIRMGKVQQSEEGKKRSRANALKRTKEQRQAERARARAKKGKAYTPGGAAAANLQVVSKNGATWYVKLGTAFDRHQSRVAEKNAREAFSWWLRFKASDDAAARFYIARPWENPRLSEADQYRIRYALDPAFNTRERLRRQIRKAAQRDGVSYTIRQAVGRNGNSPFVERELGYTIAELRSHIERQFHDGMNWERFLAGEIHIDHIQPKASFDLSRHEEWVACWSLPNLRPLWAKQNLEKSSKQVFLL